MNQNLFVLFSLLMSLSGFAQQKGYPLLSYPLVEHPQVLDLRYAEVYEYSLQLPEHPITVPASKLDWEKVVAEAGAMLDLKTVLLPEKELLFSFALNLELLTGMQTSIFWYRKTRYAEFLKKWLTEEEAAYFDEIRKQLDEWGDHGLSRIALWKQLIQQTTKAEQFEVFGDSLLAYSYRVKGHDAEEFEAVLQAYWGMAYASEGEAAKAAPHLQRCFDIRRRRGDVLTYSIDRLIQAYVQSEQIDSALQVCREVMEYVTQHGPTERKVAYYSFWQVMNFEAQYGDPEHAFMYYENVYHNLAIRFSYFPAIWADGQQLPYYHAIKAAETDEQRLAYFKRWGEGIRRYAPKRLWREAIYDLILLSKEYEGEELAYLMQDYFEDFFVKPEVDWTFNPASFWYQVVPYPRLLEYADNTEQKVILLNRWMEQALLVNYSAITKETALSVSDKLLKLGATKRAFEVFEKYFYALMDDSDEDLISWAKQGLFDKLKENQKPEWEAEWLRMAKEHGSVRMQGSAYVQIAQYYYHKKDYQTAFKWYDEWIAWMDEVDYEYACGCYATAAANSRYAAKYYKSLEYTINMTECYGSDGFYGLTTLNAVVSRVYYDEEYAKDKQLQKAFIKRLKKWKKSLKKRGDKASKKQYDWVVNNIGFLENRWKGE